MSQITATSITMVLYGQMLMSASLIRKVFMQIVICDVTSASTSKSWWFVMSWNFLEITFESRFTPAIYFWRKTILFIDPVLVPAVVLLFLTIAITLLYYGRIRRVSKAYEEAKSAVGDIVISFDKQLQRQGEQLAATTQKVEILSVKNERISERLDDQGKHFETRLADLSSKVAGLPSVDSVKGDLETLKKKIEDTTKIQNELKQQAVVASDSQIETAIPIKRERALAPLTETELRVLELIAEAGEKTAPEIKAMIKLTREHTARLMKKLYEAGYLERRSEKTPYAYRVKEEMVKILKKSEVKA